MTRAAAGLRPVGPLWRGAAVLIALGVLAPVLSLAWMAAGSNLAHWGHLLRHVLPDAALNTALPRLSGGGSESRRPGSSPVPGRRHGWVGPAAVPRPWR